MKDKEKTKEQLVNKLEASGTTRKRAGQAIPERRIWLPIVGTFPLLCILVWLDEIVDLPHLLLGAPRTPINWQEASLETFLIAAAGFFVVSNLILVTRRRRAEEALRHSRENWENIFRSVSDTVIILNPDQTITDANRATVQAIGKPKDGIIGHHCYEYFHGADSPPENCPFLSLLKSEHPQTAETKVMKAFDGTYLVTVSPIFDAEGRIAKVIHIAKDISERKRAEEALRESEARYRLLAENVTDVIWTLDMNLRFTYVSPSTTHTSGYSVEEAMALTVEEILTPSSLETVMKVFAEKMAVEEMGQKDLSRSVTLELEYYCKDGSTIWAESKMAGLRDSDNRLVGILGVTRDTTERKRAEEERAQLLAQIQEQAQQVQQIVDTVPEGVLLLDADGQVVLVNPVAEKDLAVLADAEVGDTLTRLGDRPLAELLTSPPKGLWHEVATDSRRFEIIARPLETGPMPEGWVLVTRDMTRERELQRYSQQQERLATVGQLAAGIAHDFNNIMATIVLYAHMLLRKEDLFPRERERLVTINQQALHATSLIHQILDFSRRSVLERRPLDLSPLLKEHVKLLERTLPESIQIALAYGPDEYTVNADPTRVQQVMMNLALNARDAMPEGENLRFGLERIQVQPGESPPLPGMAEGEWVQVTVSDTGTGIPPDVLPHIFDPFFTTKAPGEGSGLGLAQVHGIVKQHDGHIDVESQVGQGTTFTIYLPALPVHAPEAVALELPALVKGQGETILVVEDNTATREALVDSLELLNYRTLEAADGREALAIFEQEGRIALVLSDVVMPEMGGQALFHALRQRDPTVKVVLLTGHPLEKELENLQAQGLSGWLLKPPSLEQLAQVLAQVLNS